MIEQLYLVGVAFFTMMALRDRTVYGRGFLFDFFTTALIMAWPVTLALCLCAEMKRKLMQ